MYWWCTSVIPKHLQGRWMEEEQFKDRFTYIVCWKTSWAFASNIKTTNQNSKHQQYRPSNQTLTTAVTTKLQHWFGFFSAVVCVVAYSCEHTCLDVHASVQTYRIYMYIHRIILQDPCALLFVSLLFFIYLFACLF